MRLARRLLLIALLLVALLLLRVEEAGGASFAGDIPVAEYAWSLPLFTLPPVLLAFGVGLFIQRRWPSATAGWWVRLLLAVAVTVWVAGLSFVAFELSGFDDGSPGWGYALLMYALGAAQLAAAWWAEDRLSRRKGG